MRFWRQARQVVEPHPKANLRVEREVAVTSDSTRGSSTPDDRPARVRRRWYRRPLLLIPLLFCLLVLVLWAASDTIARAYTKRAFARMKGFDGLFTTAHVSLPELAYTTSFGRFLASASRSATLL